MTLLRRECTQNFDGIRQAKYAKCTICFLILHLKQEDVVTER